MGKLNGPKKLVEMRIISMKAKLKETNQTLREHSFSLMEMFMKEYSRMVSSMDKEL